MMFGKKFVITVCNEENYSLYENHTTYHQGDSGLDLYIVSDEFIPPHQTTFVKLGIKCQSQSFQWCVWKWFKRGFTKYNSYFLFPRSSISKTPLLLKNSIGLIDSGYTGEIIAALYNSSSDPFFLQRGERYVQLVNADLSPVSFELAKHLRTTERGSGGFGSTGGTGGSGSKDLENLNSLEDLN
uniref:dUTP diphosphatase n=1 Tax=viral metagenome TaxID=1070528 RepID=A0A6C0E0V0_9ZZZZ